MIESAARKSNQIGFTFRRNNSSEMASGKVESAIRRRVASGRKALVPFFTAGFPDRASFLSLLRAAQEIGCDAIEVGIPFSDPIADGPSIQFSNQHVLQSGMKIARALEFVAEARIDIPILLMGYLNPILSYGLQRFVNDAKAIGVAGAIVPDLPSDSLAVRNGLDFRILGDLLETVLMVAPTTTAERMAFIGKATQGFLYAVTVTGTTGARATLATGIDLFLRNARRATARPVLAGFGISNPKNGSAIARHCDGVIVGSALIEQIRSGPPRGGVKRVSNLLRDLRKAL